MPNEAVIQCALASMRLAEEAIRTLREDIAAEDKQTRINQKLAAALKDKARADPLLAPLTLAEPPSWNDHTHPTVEQRNEALDKSKASPHSFSGVEPPSQAETRIRPELYPTAQELTERVTDFDREIFAQALTKFGMAGIARKVLAKRENSPIAHVALAAIHQARNLPNWCESQGLPAPTSPSTAFQSGRSADPLDTPLPCTVFIDGMIFGEGVTLRTLVDAARRWKAAASINTPHFRKSEEQ